MLPVLTSTTASAITKLMQSCVFVPAIIPGFLHHEKTLRKGEHLCIVPFFDVFNEGFYVVGHHAWTVFTGAFTSITRKPALFILLTCQFHLPLFSFDMILHL